MRAPNLQLLTYLAQVRQLPFRSEWLLLLPVPTMHPILPIKTTQKYGTSHKGIVTTGTVLAVVWEEQSKNMVAWLKVAGYWHKRTSFILSPSPAEERR